MVGYIPPLIYVDSMWMLTMALPGSRLKAQEQECKRKTASIASLYGQGSGLPGLFLIVFDLHCAQSIIPYRQHTNDRTPVG